MLNHEITPTADGATGRIYLVQLGMNGPGSVARHGGSEDVYVRTLEGWRIKSRTHVRNKAWHSEKLKTPDLIYLRAASRAASRSTSCELSQRRHTRTRRTRSEIRRSRSACGR